MQPSAWPFIARLRTILYIRFTPLFAALPDRALQLTSPASVGQRLLKVAGYAGLRLVGNVVRPHPSSEPLRGAVWLYVVSQNNYEALQFLRDTVPGAVLVAGQSKQIGRYNGRVLRLSLRRKLLHYWQFPLALATFLRTEGRVAWRFFDLVFNAVGYYEEYRRAVRRYRPRAVVFANDHNDDARALLLACRAEGVPTAYVQHASVSTNFPPLEFNLNLLEGQDALDKYRQCGPVQGRVELVGMPKADAALAARNREPYVRRVGIASNLLDDITAIEETIETLLHRFPEVFFTFRPHPSDTRDVTFLQRRHPRLALSNAREETIFDFLSRQDALIAADTSTHLEATMLNIVGLYYRFGTHATANDYYGYVHQGLVERAPTLPELVMLLARYTAHKPLDHYRRATYYNAALGTDLEGQSQPYVAQLLNGWLSAEV